MNLMHKVKQSALRFYKIVKRILSIGKNRQNPESLLFMNDDHVFNEYYNRALEQTNTEHRPARKHRFFNIYSILNKNFEAKGDYVEFGCWKGASSHLILQTIVDSGLKNRNKRLYIFDSFEGLSIPQKKDNIRSNKVAKMFDKKINSPFKAKNSYNASLDNLDNNLKDYTGLYTATKIWIDSGIMDKKIELPDQIAFANIDLDLYEPTYFAIKLVLDRLAKQGVIVCDDYGSVSWPGARDAVNQIVDEYNLKLIELSSGQALIFKNL